MDQTIRHYSPKEFASIIGVSTSTLRRWEKEGLVTSLRTPEGERSYTSDMTERYQKQKEYQAYLKSQLSKKRIAIENTHHPQPLFHRVIENWHKIGLVMFVLSLLFTLIAAANILKNTPLEQSSWLRPLQSVLAAFDRRVPQFNSLFSVGTPARPVRADTDPDSIPTPTVPPSTYSGITLTALRDLYTDLVARFDAFTAQAPPFAGRAITNYPGTNSPTPTPVTDITSFPHRSHSSLTNLTNSDDHTQYLYGSGRAGGQTLVGGINANDILTLQSSTATTGTGSGEKALKIIVGSGGETEALTILNNGNIGFQKTNPGFTLDVGGIVNATAIYANGTPMVSSQWTSTNTNIFYTTGNVGIGTSTPTTSLDIGGTLKTTGLAFPTGAVAGYVLTTDANGVASWTDVSSSAGPWGLTGNNLFPDSTSNNLAIGATDAGSAKLYVNGNVGIGTTAPTKQLHIYQDASNEDQIFLANPNTGVNAASGIVFNNNGAGSASLRFHGSTYTRASWQNYLGLSANASAAGIVIASANATGNIKFAAGSNTNYRMLIDGATGNVGIGVTAPVRRLDLLSASTTYNNTSQGAIGVTLSTDTTELLNIGWDDTLNTTGAAYFQAHDVGVGQMPIYLNPAGGAVVIGRNSAPSSSALTVYRGEVLRRSTNDAITNPLAFQKDRVGAILQNGDEMGVITFEGYDGSAYLQSAYIFGKIEGTPALGVMPGNLGFYTRGIADSNPVERLRISASGNVGIGTTSPAYKLDVVGGDGSQGVYAVRASGISPDGSAFLAAPVGGGYHYAGATNVSLVAFNGSASVRAASGNNNVELFSSGTGNINFTTNGSERVRFDSAGSVGIGTTAPIQKLHVAGGGNIRAGGNYFTDNGTYYLWADSTGAYIDNTGSSNTGILMVAKGSDPLVFNVNTSTEAMRITSSSNVGIGTTSPGAPLHVYATTSGYTPALWVSDQNPTLGGALYFQWRGGAVNNKIHNIVADSNGLSFYRMNDTGSAFVNATPDLAMSPSGNVTMGQNLTVSGAGNSTIAGNVGIGTTSPEYKLDVDGTIRGSMYLYLKDGGENRFQIQSNGGTNYINNNYYNSLIFQNTGNELARYNASGWYFTSGKVGIGTTAPTSILSVGASSQFQVDSSGNIVKLNNVTTSFPSSQGAANSVLRNDGAGTLTWADPTGTGVMGYWQRNGTSVAPTTITDSLGIGTTAPAGKFDITDTSNTLASFSLTNNTATTIGAGLNTAGILDLQSTSLSTGNFLNMEVNGLTTGKGLNLTSNSTVLSTGNLASIDWSPSGSTEIFATGDLFKINTGTYANIGNLFALYDDGSELFSVDQSKITNSLPTEFTSPGDVSMAYDLQFTNASTANIKSDGPLTISSGEVFGSNNLTLKTYNQGAVLVDYADSGTTANNHTALQLSPAISGAISTGTRNIYGLYNNPMSTAANSGGTSNLYGSYISPSSTLAIAGATNVYGSYISGTATHAADAGTVNQYGLYIANGTSSTNGASTKYGLYVEAPTGADTNYAAIFAGGNVGIGTTNPSASMEIQAPNMSTVALKVRYATGVGGNLAEFYNRSGALSTTINYDGLLYSPTLSTENLSFGSGANIITADPNRNIYLGVSGNGGSLMSYRVFKAPATATNTLAVQAVTSQTSKLFTWLDSSGVGLGVIDVAGNVGIGTTNPAATLDVAASLSSSQPYALKVNGTGYRDTSIVTINNNNSTDGNAGLYYPSGLSLLMPNMTEDKYMTGLMFGTGLSARNSAALQFHSVTSGSTSNYGSFGLYGVPDIVVFNGNGSVGIGTTSPGYTLDVKSTGTNIARFTGTNSTGCTLSDGGVIACSSDRNLKKNILDTQLGLDAVMALKPVEFNWNSQATGEKKYLGFIAQDVEQVAPSLVTTDSNGYKQLNSIGLIPLVAKAIQEQQGQITMINDQLSMTNGELTTKVTAWDAILTPLQAIVQDIQNMFISLQTQLGLVRADVDSTKDQVASLSASLNSMNVDYTSWKEAMASGSGVLGASDSAMLEKVATVSSLLVQNKTTTFDLTVLNKLTSGVIEIGAGIDGDEINSAGGIRFQTLSQGPIDFMNGKVVVDVDGSITAKHLKLDTTDFTSSTAGTAVLKAGKSVLTVDTSSITPNSLVFITPITLTDIPIAVTQKSTGIGFTVTIPQTIGKDLEFQWLVIN